MGIIASSVRHRVETGPFVVALRVGIVALTLATAYIHVTLGGLLFLANAAGYLVLATSMVAPIAIAARWRWLIRAGLAGFTTATVIGWLMFGARFQLAYVDKVLELGLISLLVGEMHLFDGGPGNVLRRSVDLAADLVRLPFSGRGRPA